MATSSGSVPSRDDVKNVFSQLSQVIHAALRPLPTETGDSTYLPTEQHPSFVEQLKVIDLKNAKTVTELVAHTTDGSPVDDRTYMMERVIQLAAQLPVSSTSSDTLSNAFMTQLWNDLKHPPLSYLGDDYVYRKADGSQNNIMWPHIGAAGMPYARTVKPKTVQPIALPDPGTIFDSIMVRKDYKEHPNKISTVLFHLASIIIHDLFRTSHQDPNISMTSSYLDLAPLYGSNQEEQDVMRTFKDGKIKPDCFSEKRILGFPPGVGVLLIMFNRFHNHTVEQLALIDENGRFSSIRGKSEAKYDNALFQTGRLITCGLYIQIVLQDYVRTILNLNRTDSKWNLDPRSESGHALFGKNPAEGVGNQVSAEFNLVYRWHSCISKKDEGWTNEVYQQLFPPGQKYETKDIVNKLAEWSRNLPNDPQARPFANLKRTSSGHFDDEDLAAIFTACVDDAAGAYGANQVPKVLREVEILGIIQARSWNLASLNEFRQYFKLEPHKTFEDINPDPYVAEQLKRLYDHPDYVELYPGLAIEASKEPMAPGSGLCPGYTISRAVLADAVALVRGDRFYTVDYTPRNLTNFGFNEASADSSVDNGHVFYKLVLRAFPRSYRQNSIYAHFPLVVPDENLKILSNLDTAQHYNFDKPCAAPEVVAISSYAACKSILENKADYKITWGVDSIDFLLHAEDHNYGQNFMLSSDGEAHAKSRECMQPGLYPGQSSHEQGTKANGKLDPPRWEQEVKLFYEDITLRMLHQNSYQVAGVNQVDVVRDVSNLAQVHFASSVFSLPLKTERNPHGIYSETELYTVLAVVFICIFYDGDPAKSFPLRQTARALTQQLGQLIEFNVQFVSHAGFVANILDRLYHHGALTDYGTHLIQELVKGGSSVKDIVWTNILPTAVAMVANQSQLFSQCLEYYLTKGNSHLPEIHRLAKLDTAEADDVLLHYFLEGTRLSSAVGLYRDVAQSGEVIDQDRTVEIKAGQRIFCNLMSASRDPQAFPNPDTVDLHRDVDSYIHYGIGPHECLGKGLSMIGLTAMLKTVGKLSNLQPVKGPQGIMKKVAGPHGLTLYMTQDESSYFPFPTGLKVNWDGELPPLKSE